MHYFVKNPDINNHINTIHLYVQEGRLDAEIAGLLNKKGIKNLQSKGSWTEDQIEQIRWDYKLDSETPATIGEDAFRKEQKKNKPGIIWTTLAVIVTSIYLIMVYSLAFSEGLAGSKLIVYLLTAVITPFIVVGLFQIFPAFRSSRPRLVLFFWVVLIMIFTNSQKTLLPVLPLIEGRQLPDITTSTDPVTSNVRNAQTMLEAKIEEGLTAIKRLYEQKMGTQPPVEETPPEEADETDKTESQPPVEEAPEKAGESDVNKSDASDPY